MKAKDSGGNGAMKTKVYIDTLLGSKFGIRRKSDNKFYTRKDTWAAQVPDNLDFLRIYLSYKMAEDAATKRFGFELVQKKEKKT